MPSTADTLLERYLAISRAIAGQLDYRSVLLEISGEVNHLMAHDHMDVSLIVPDRREDHVVYEVGLTTEWGDFSVTPQPIAFSPIRDLLLGKVDYYLTDDAPNDARFHFENALDAPIFKANLRSRLHVPMHVHGIVQGTLNISSHQTNTYTEDDLHTAKQIADLLAPYFYALVRSEQSEKLASAEGAARGREEVLRLGALRLTEGMENERKRIGMDLHDQTLADLSRVSRQISRLGRKRQLSISDLRILETEISTCMSELRRIIEDTKPGVMELFGFAQAVEAQLERSIAGITPKIKLSVKDTASSLLDDCPESLRTTLFRIVQEAINNAVKHGRPNRLSVTIEVRKDRLWISVADDGIGAGRRPENSRGGLDNMRVRAALISSDIEITGSIPGGGTRVSVSTPITEMTAPRKDRTFPPTRVEAAL